MQHSCIQASRRLVIKVGSSLVTNKGEGLDRQSMSMWASQIAQLRAMGKQVVLVSSGAIAEGMARLHMLVRPSTMSHLQAAAAVGQMGLVQAYETIFQQHAIQTAQILLTHEDLSDRTRYLNARAALFSLLDLQVVPIVNENDTVVTDEIRVGDNDTLGALVTNLIDADALVILTDTEGLYRENPRENPSAEFVQVANAGDPVLETMAGGAGSAVGTGGMYTKIIAAKRAARSGAHTVIASGHYPDILVRLAQGEMIGTELRATQNPISAKRQWMADHIRVRGTLYLDRGAVQAITQLGKSLLPIGVTKIEGEFYRGDLVACLDEQGVEVARGLINYTSSDTQQMLRRPSREISTILGNMREEELVHHNNMVVLSR